MEVDEFELDIDPSTVCRICLSQTNKLQNIFASTVVDGYIIKIPDMVSDCLGIQALPLDGFPDKICSVCKIEIIKFYVFKQKSSRTDEILTKTFRKPPPEKEISLSTIAPKPKFLEIINPINKTTKDNTLLKVQHEREDQSEQHLDKKYIKTEIEQSDEYENHEEIEDDEDEDLLHILDETFDEKKTELECHEDDADEETISSVNVPKTELPQEMDDDSNASKYFCIKCNQYTEDNKDLKNHECRVEFHCKLCSKKYTTKNRLLAHVRKHMGSTFTDDKSIIAERQNEDHNNDVDNENGKIKATKTLEINNEENVENEGDGDDVDRIQSVDDEEMFEEATDFYECDICSELFIDKKKYIKHCQEHDMNCNQCEMEFNNEDELIEHSQTVHGTYKSEESSNYFFCKLCNKDMKSRQAYTHHTKLHEAMKIITNCLTFYKCFDCRMIHLTEPSLMDHRNQAHSTDHQSDASCTDYQYLEDVEEEEHICGICNQTYPNLESVKHHMILHSDKFVCPFNDCGCQYDVFSRLSTHITNKHTNSKLYKCKHCLLNLNSFDDLQKHMKCECPERKYSCNHCEKKFFSKKALQHHTKTTKGKKFICQFCGKSFSQQGELTIHNRSHTGERPFECTVCGKAYKTSSMRAAHMDAHIKGKTFSCTLCDKKLQTRTSYRNHMKRHTEDKKHACEYCGRKFFSKYHARLHASKIHERQNQLQYVVQVENVEMIA